ncbi:DUF1127 domain-containing protein [uncultured Amaricoccus sp.]|uniref:DUF1127 domain-containing protein n=1 Tax=uncultured Amaricoccus sp. TaxID=339341 RepID=UPI002626648B|nr:DUF1127 domain-containing protein [uncultured Amaricoccus sp.]
MAHAIYPQSYQVANEPGLFARVSKAFADRRAYLEIYRELAAHSDRDLCDLGISRHNIRDIARQAVHGA